MMLYLYKYAQASPKNQKGLTASLDDVMHQMDCTKPDKLTPCDSNDSLAVSPAENRKEEPQVNTLTVIAGLFLGYASYTAMRKVYPQQMASIAQDVGIPLAQLGLPNSVFAATYGVAKFFGALASDHVPCAKFHALGVLLCGLCCAALSICSSLCTFSFLWGLQGVLQGFGWPTLMNIVVSDLPPMVRTKYWGLLSAASSVGQTVGPYAMARAEQAGMSWRAVNCMIGCSVAALSVPVWLLLRSGGTGSTSAKQNCQASQSKAQAAGTKSSLATVFCSPAILILIVCNFLCNFVLKSTSEWGLIFLQSTRLASTQIDATKMLLCAEVGGGCGALTSGYFSAQLGGRHGFATFLLTVLLTTALAATWWCAYIDAPVPFVALCALHAVSGFAMRGMGSLLGLHAATVSAASGALGMATGIVDIVGQFGAVMAGQPIGAFAASSSKVDGRSAIEGNAEMWVTVMGLIAVASAALAALHIPLLPLEQRRMMEKTKVE